MKHRFSPLSGDQSHSAMIPQPLLQAIRDKTCILYAGAGFSLEASSPDGHKLPTGNGLGYRLALELQRAGHLLEEPKEDGIFDFITLAENYETAFGRRHLILLLHDIFYAEGVTPGEAHHLALEFFPLIITTNYDPLFEHAAILQGRPPIVIRRDKQTPFIGAGNRTTIIKIHGDLEDPERLVITNEDYRREPIPEGLSEKLRTLFSERTVLFIGSGLVDSDFQEIYYQVLKRLGDIKPLSFAVVPFPNRDASYYGQWELTRRRWEQRGMNFLDYTAGEFLQQLKQQL
ncbi:MAG TPA: SIR2 family protein, partial [Blastocatellia bacterium]